MGNRAWCAFAAAPILVAGMVAAHATASDATTPDSTASHLRFDVRFSPFQLIDVGAPGLSNGDEIVFHDRLLSHGRRVGDELGNCVIVDDSIPLANCTMVIRLHSGNITAQFANSPPPRKTLALTGGSGAYRSIGGDGTLTENGDGTGTLSLRIVA